LPARVDIVDDERRLGTGRTKGQPVLTDPFPTMCRTVWQDRSLPRGVLRAVPRPYATNHEALIDEDGHLWVLGRSDDVINVAAHRISRWRSKRRSARPPAWPRWPWVGCRMTQGHLPVAFAVLRPDADEPTVRAAAEAAWSEIGGYARLGNLYVAKALPKTRTGKTMPGCSARSPQPATTPGTPPAMEDPAAIAAVCESLQG